MFRLQTSEPYFAVGLEPIAGKVYLLGATKLIIFLETSNNLTAKVLFRAGGDSLRPFVISHFCLPYGNEDFAKK